MLYLVTGEVSIVLDDLDERHLVVVYKSRSTEGHK